MKKSTTKNVVLGGVIGAVYIVLTLLSSSLNLAFGPIQIRFSEILSLLPVFSPIAISGLTVGCFISNFASFTPFDLIFGTLATFISAYLSYKFRNIITFGVPIISLIAPVIVNSIIIGAEISVFYLGGFTLLGFVVSAGEVALGEFIATTVLGIPLYKILKKHENNLF